MIPSDISVEKRPVHESHYASMSIENEVAAYCDEHEELD
jgi:hypothetical protein